MQNTHETNAYTKIIVQTGLLIALALVIKSFSTYIYIAGAPVVRISFSGPFSAMPGILFGSLVGGITSGLVDVIGYLIKPQGGYIPWLTATSILGGILRPFIWKKINKINVKHFQTTFIFVFAVIGLIGITNHIMITFVPNSHWAHYIMNLGKKFSFATIGLEITGTVGLLLFLIDKILRKNFNNPYIHEYFLKLIIAIGIPGIIVTTLNTEILRIFIPVLSGKAFIIFWIPRLIEELFMTIYISYALSIFLQLYNKLYKNK